MGRRRYEPPVQTKTEKSKPLGYPSLDATGKVPSAELPASSGGGTGANVGNQYLVGASAADLTAERVVTDTTSLHWDLATAGQAKANVQFGTTLGTAAQGNDARLSDARTPTAHAASHASGGGDPVTLAESQVTNLVTDLAAKVPTTRTVSTTAPLTGGGALSGDLTLAVSGGTTAAAGVLQLATSAQTTAGLAVQASDTRLSDSRTPTAHAASHNAGGSDALAIDAAAATGSLRTLGTGATQAAAGTDSRFTDARTPTSHVLATNLALGGQHTISGATAGQVLRASSATAANFQALVAGDLPSLPESQVTNLVTDLAGKAASVHTHAESDVTNLVTDLAAKETKRLQARMTADQAAIGTAATALTGLSLALAAATHYRFHAVVMYLCAVTTATLAARVAYSGTLGTNASGESLYKVYGSSGVPTVWAAAAKETTQIVSAAIITATGGPGASGTATVPCLLEIEGDIFTNAGGNLTIELVASAAAGIAPQADSHLEAWIML